jgi:hypothetical protein
MVNATPMRAITITCIKGAVMYKSFKIFIDFIPYHNFFGMRINNLTACIGRKASFETGCTVAVIFNATTTTINPINAIRTSSPTAVGHAFIGFAYCTHITIRFNTSVATTVCYTFIGFTYGT